MIDSISEDNILKIIKKQLNNFYFLEEEEEAYLEKLLPECLERLEYRFSHLSNKYYRTSDGKTNFDVFHTGMYLMLLYEIGHSVFLSGNNLTLCEKIYGLSKIVSSADLFYGINLPDIYFFDHPQGTVLGRAEYSDYFVFMQGCTVGNNKGKYPRIGEHVYMMSDSKILGNCIIGDHVILSANSFVKDTNILSYTIVYGVSPDLILRRIAPAEFETYSLNFFIK